MKIFIGVMVAMQVIAFVTDLVELGKDQSWPKVIKRNRSVYAVAVAVELSLAAWGTWVLFR